MYKRYTKQLKNRKKGISTCQREKWHDYEMGGGLVWREKEKDEKGKDRVSGPLPAFHTSGTEWSMADRRRPVDILDKKRTINAESTMIHTDKLMGSQENWQVTWAILVVSLCIVINYFQCCNDYCWAHLCHIPDGTVGSSYWLYEDGRNVNSR